MDELVDYATRLADPSRWARFQHRAGDIVISTPPKCGTTWMQMLSALLIFDDTDLPSPLYALSPWLDFYLNSEDEVFSLLDGQRHRRFIKTHTPLDGIPLHDDVTYVVVGRDPRDAMVSFEHHMGNIDMEKVGATLAAQGRLEELRAGPPPLAPDPDPTSRFRTFRDDDSVQNEAPTLHSVLNHLDTAWQRRKHPNIGMWHYRDLQQDLPGEMARLADVLETALPPDRVETLARMATLESMRADAEHVAPELGIWRDAAAFFRSGGSGEWSGRGTPEDHERYSQRVDQLVSPNLAAWAHDGRIASGIDPGS